MTQNLRLVGPKTLTSEESDVATSYNLPASSTSGWCTNTTEACTNTQNVLYTNNTNYGTYYNWRAATAGIGTYSVTSGNVSGSVCAKGWRLPTGGLSGEFYGVFSAYGMRGDILTSRPVELVLSGYRNFIYSFGQGEYGDYWSSTASDSLRAGFMTITPSVFDVSFETKYYGMTIRCVAR